MIAIRNSGTLDGKTVLFLKFLPEDSIESILKKMTEPKTLKDLQKDYEWKWDTFNALKKEAIKWVKKDKEDIQKEDSIITPIFLKRWMRRLNITEEDLK